MPLPFEEFQGKGVFNFSSPSSSSSSFSETLLNQFHNPNPKSDQEKEEGERTYLCYVGAAISEPNSVLDTLRSPSPSPLASSSTTLSSSQGGNSGGGGGAASTAVEDPIEKCGQMGTAEDWDSVLSGSPVHEQSILRLIMGDVEDPSIGLNKILQQPSSAFQSDAVGFGVVDPTSFGLDSIPSGLTADSLCSSGFPADTQNANALFSSVSSVSLSQSAFQPHTLQGFEDKPQILNPQVIINQNQTHFTQNPPMFMPVHYGQLQEHYPVGPPPAKRLNQGFDSGFNPDPRTRPGLQKPTSAATATHQQIQQIQQGLTDQIFRAAELIETGGDSVLAQGILARLNQQLSSPVGKPFQRAAFYIKEALQKLLHTDANADSSSQAFSSSYNLILKINAYKSFSEISPVLQFSNFTCNQALLESFLGYDRVHVVDFDVGYGGQWASLMQELVLRNGGVSMKLTVFASPAVDDIEIAFTLENLKSFANEINIAFEIEVLSVEMLNSSSVSLIQSENEAIAVNLPLSSSFSQNQSYLPLVLRFVKQISPKIVVSSDRGCERTDLPFPYQLLHSLQSHSALLESLDAVNANLDTMQKIEKFLIQPSIENAVLKRRLPSNQNAVIPWRALFSQCGFSPLMFSNFTESQAECLIQRTPIRGFHVEKKQNNLVLYWHRKELVAVSAWRC